MKNLDNSIKSMLRHSSENLKNLEKLKKNPSSKGVFKLFGRNKLDATT